MQKERGQANSSKFSAQWSCTVFPSYNSFSLQCCVSSASELGLYKVKPCPLGCISWTLRLNKVNNKDKSYDYKAFGFTQGGEG